MKKYVALLCMSVNLMVVSSEELVRMEEVVEHSTDNWIVDFQNNPESYRSLLVSMSSYQLYAPDEKNKIFVSAQKKSPNLTLKDFCKGDKQIVNHYKSTLNSFANEHRALCWHKLKGQIALWSGFSMSLSSIGLLTYIQAPIQLMPISVGVPVSFGLSIKKQCDKKYKDLLREKIDQSGDKKLLAIYKILDCADEL